MDKIVLYRNVIKKIITRYGTGNPPEGFDEYESQIVFDDENGHFYLMDIGWNKMERIHGCVLHIDLKDDKVWIQQDWTDSGVADELIAEGVKKEDIVLAFHAPYKRPYTGYAVA